MFREYVSFPDRNTLPRISLRWVSGGDSVITLVQSDRSQAGVIFRGNRHSTSPMTSLGLASIRSEERFGEEERGEFMQRNESVWRPSSETGLMACRVVSQTAMILSVVQDDHPTHAHMLVTSRQDEVFSYMDEKVIVSESQLSFFLDLPFLMRSDWKDNKYGFSHNVGVHDAIRQNPRLFNFQEGITQEVESILERLQQYHPDTYLYDPKD